MDQNANLQDQLDICTEAICLGGDFDLDLLDTEESQAIISTYLRLCNLVEVLNEWIRNGGALPEVWQVEQDKLSSEYFKAALSERFPWLREIPADGSPTPDYEEPSGADVVQELGELWTEVISDGTLKPELVPLSLYERQLLGAILTKVRENIGETGFEIEDFGEDDIYSGSFDILRKLDGQPQPPQPSPTEPEPHPVEFMTDDGYKLIWDQVNRRWSTRGGDVFNPGGWTWWPFDCFGEPVSGRLLP